MKTIKLVLEYKCFPIWIYDENENLIDNDLPIELRSNKNLDDKLVEIQAKYDDLFIDNGIEFKFTGFDTDTKKSEFKKEIEEIYLKISNLLEKSYNIKNCVELN